MFDLLEIEKIREQLASVFSKFTVREIMDSEELTVKVMDIHGKLYNTLNCLSCRAELREKLTRFKKGYNLKLNHLMSTQDKNQEGVVKENTTESKEQHHVVRRFKPGYPGFRFFGKGELWHNGNITDEIIAMILKENPKNAKLFDEIKVPIVIKEVEKVVEKIVEKIVYRDKPAEETTTEEKEEVVEEGAEKEATTEEKKEEVSTSKTVAAKKK